MTFDQILEFIRTQDALIVYAILLLSAIVENIFPPYPGDLVTLSGAFLAGEGNIGYVGVMVSVIIGGVAGGMILYLFGKSKGRKFLINKKLPFLKKINLEKIENLFKKHGDSIVILSRFMAGVRSIVILVAGIGNIKTSRMVVLLIISVIIWNGLLITMMYYTKSNWTDIVDLVKEYNKVFIGIALILIIGWIVKVQWTKRKI